MLRRVSPTRVVSVEVGKLDDLSRSSTRRSYARLAADELVLWCDRRRASSVLEGRQNRRDGGPLGLALLNLGS
jgi:hypothetical protein